MRKTKIVCTIGPASGTREKIDALINSGMNVARLNFSHGTHEYHGGNIKLLKEARAASGKPLAIMLDTRGPEIRTGVVGDGGIAVRQGSEVRLTYGEGGSDGEIRVNCRCLTEKLRAGDKVLIDDGGFELEVIESSAESARCRVLRGGTLRSSKGVNVPGVRLDMPYLSAQDKADVVFGVEQGVDFVAASFVRTPADVEALRKLIDYNGGRDIQIIAKIENEEGVENFDEILRAADGIMVARGDMGVEIAYERLPGLQKTFIRKCYSSGKMVITATQMLESMIHSPVPTRAEISDVANAVFDGTSAIMLSGETAAGEYPIEAVRTMARIAEQAERDALAVGAYRTYNYETDAADTTNAVCDAACTLARDIRAKAIIALSKYGGTARRMSKFRPAEPIVAATPVEKTFHQLSLSWGVYPVLARCQRTTDELFQHAEDCARQIDAVKAGDRVVIVAGIPLDTSGSTNIIKAVTVGERR